MVGSAEFAEWQGFYELEPWGGAVENWRAAMIAQTVANVAGRKLKRCARLSDFMPQQARPQTRASVIAALEGAAGGNNGE